MAGVRGAKCEQVSLFFFPYFANIVIYLLIIFVTTTATTIATCNSIVTAREASRRRPQPVFPSRLRHHMNHAPNSGQHSFKFSLTHSLTLTFLNLHLTATVPSCHPARRRLPSILLSTRIITKLFYQIFRVSISAYYAYSLVWFFRRTTHFGQLNLFFLRVLLQPKFFFALRKPRVQRIEWPSLQAFLSFKLAIFFPWYNSDTDINTLTFHLFQVPIPAPAITCFDTFF